MFSVSAAFAQSEAELKANIEMMNKEMAKAMISGDTEKSMAFYASDVISMPNYDKMISGIEAMIQSNEQMKKSGWKVVDFKPVTLSVKKYGNMVTEIGTYDIAFSVEGQTNNVTDKGKYLTQWEIQKDGKMKIKVEIWNTDKFPVTENKEE